MLGIIIGVASVSTMVTLGRGAQAHIDAQIEALGTNLLLVVPAAADSGGVRLGAGTRLRLTEADAHALKNQIPEIVASAATINAQVQLVVGNRNWQTALQGVDLDYLIARNWATSLGRSFDGQEISRGARVAILGATIAKELFGGRNPVGQSMRINKVRVKIVGVLSAKGRAMMGQDQDDLVIVPRTAARMRLVGRNRVVSGAVDLIVIRVAEVTTLDTVKDQITVILRERHRLTVGQRDTFRILEMSDFLQTRMETTEKLNLLLTAVASVSLLVGGIGIMNIMLVSVTERTGEIGLRRAIGARQRDILAQFLVEAVTLSTLGGALGVAIAMGTSVAIAAMADLPIAIDFAVIAIAVLFSATVGICFGYYPARKAAFGEPIEALRYE